MSWEELYKQVVKNISYWGSYVSMRTSLEKQDVEQELLLVIWQTYCDKTKSGKGITKGYAQYRLKFAASRIMTNFFSNNETKLGVVEIGENVPHEDIPYFLDPPFIRNKMKNEVEKAYTSSSKKEKYMRVLDLLLEGKNRKETAEEMMCSIGSISVIVNEKIKPVIEKSFECF